MRSCIEIQKRKRQRTGRKDSKEFNQKLSFVKNKRKNSFYLVDTNSKIHEKTFGSQKYFLQMKMKKRKDPQKHHEQVKLALDKFNEEQNIKILEMEKADFKLGPQTKQALAYLEACSKLDFLNIDEKIN